MPDVGCVLTDSLVNYGSEYQRTHTELEAARSAKDQAQSELTTAKTQNQILKTQIQALQAQSASLARAWLIQPTEYRQNAREPTNNLPTDWSGRRVQLLNVATSSAIDFGADNGNAAAYLYGLGSGCPMWDWKWQALRLELVNSGDPDQGWLIRTKEDNSPCHHMSQILHVQVADN